MFLKRGCSTLKLPTTSGTAVNEKRAVVASLDDGLIVSIIIGLPDSSVSWISTTGV